MPNFNQVTLAGHLSRDVEMVSTRSGFSIANVGIAVNDRVKKDDQWVDESSFFELKLFGKTAEFANEYTRKGDAVLVTGRLKQETWEKDGKKNSKVVVIADKYQSLSSRKNTKSESKSDDDKGGDPF